MNYNKLQSLAANVTAIETAVAIHRQHRKATQEEKQVLAQYSGFGGVKEVLGIGTQIPMPEDMAEQINRLQEALRTFAEGSEADYNLLMDSVKSSVLTAFFTPKFLIDTVAGQIHTTFRENGLQMRTFLEPSAGTGGFLPVAMDDTRSIAFEKDCVTGLILSLLNDGTETYTAGFETISTQPLEHTGFDVIASNIPFGNFWVFDAELWKKGGIYEQATKTIHNYFFVKAMELLGEGGLLAFVTSRGIADTPGNKFVREYLVSHADLISAVRLPDTLFMQTSGIEVGSDLLIFQKHTHKASLSLRDKSFLQVAREKAGADGAMTEYANRLFSLPKTALATDSSIVRNQYGKYVRRYRWAGDESSMSRYLSALLQYDFKRYFSKNLFIGQGDASVQMSLFGETTVSLTDKGRRAYTGENDFRFESKDHARFQFLFDARSKYRRFVDFKSDAVTDELGLLSRSHELIGKTCLGNHFDCSVIQHFARNAGSGDRSDLFLNIQTNLMSGICFFRQFADREHTAHIAHISVEVASQIDHNTLSFFQRSLVSASGQGRIESATP